MGMNLLPTKRRANRLANARQQLVAYTHAQQGIALPQYVDQVSVYGYGGRGFNAEDVQRQMRASSVLNPLFAREVKNLAELPAVLSDGTELTRAYLADQLEGYLTDELDAGRGTPALRRRLRGVQDFLDGLPSSFVSLDEDGSHEGACELTEQVQALKCLLNGQRPLQYDLDAISNLNHIMEDAYIKAALDICEKNREEQQKIHDKYALMTSEVISNYARKRDEIAREFEQRDQEVRHRATGIGGSVLPYDAGWKMENLARENPDILESPAPLDLAAMTEERMQKLDQTCAVEVGPLTDRRDEALTAIGVDPVDVHITRIAVEDEEVSRCLKEYADRCAWFINNLALAESLVLGLEESIKSFSEIHGKEHETIAGPINDMDTWHERYARYRSAYTALSDGPMDTELAEKLERVEQRLATFDEVITIVVALEFLVPVYKELRSDSSLRAVEAELRKLEAYGRCGDKWAALKNTASAVVDGLEFAHHHQRQIAGEDNDHSEELSEEG